MTGTFTRRFDKFTWILLRDETPGSTDAPHSRVREVAYEERVSASDEDRIIAEVAAAWPTYIDVLQAAHTATSARVEALRKVRCH